MPWLAAGAIAAPIIGGIAGHFGSQGDSDAQKQAYQQALAAMQGVNTPDMDQMRIALQNYQSAGQLTPEMEQTIAQQASGMGNIQTDPRLQAAQMQALSRMQQIGNGGMRPEDQAALAGVRSDVAQQENARQQGILQNMQERGVGGSGAELAAQLASSQGAANRASSQGLNIAGQASQRALEAIAQSGQLGSSIRGQQFGEEAQKAQAQDVINRYNAMNSQQVSGQNTAVNNAAQAQNLANKQQLMNSNTGLGNQQEMYNKGLYQQNFNNQMQKAGGVAGANQNMGNYYGGQAANTQKMWGNVGQGVGQGAAALGSSKPFMDYMGGSKPEYVPAKPQTMSTD